MPKAELCEPIPPAQLFERIKAGDETAFNQLYSTHHERVLNAVKKFIPEPDTAEFIANGVFIKVWQVRNKPAAFKGGSTIGTWLTRIAYNAALMHLRSGKTARKRHAYSLDGTIMTAEGEAVMPDFPYHDRRLEEGLFYRRDLFMAIARMPKDYRAVFICRLIDGLSTEQTSQMLNINSALVKSRLFHGRQFLRAILTPKQKKLAKFPRTPV